MTTSAIRNGPGHRAYRRAQAALKRRAKREGLPCAWCGGPFDWSLPDTDRMSFTADHPRSLASGGRLVGQKLEAFHRSCNASKPDDAPVEIWGAS